MITHYEVLGVKANATSEQIKKARKEMALCLHPDKNVGVNEMVQRLVEERFLEVQEAYETLSDDARRKEYDNALAAVRSEGEYYVPTPKAAPPPVERKEPARCDRCQTMLGEPMHPLCEGCLNKIAALEKEVKARRQLGVTACKVCGCKLLEKSPFPGVCQGCFRHIGILEYADRCRVLCRRCGLMRVAGRYCPGCGLDSVGGGTSRSRKQSVASKGHVVSGGALSEEMSKQLRSDRWVTAGVWFVTWLFLIVTHNGGDAGPTGFITAVGMVIHCALMRRWGF